MSSSVSNTKKRAPSKSRKRKVRTLAIDETRITEIMRTLFDIPSPSGYTDNIVHHVCELLEKEGVPFELTRRGAIRATLSGSRHSPDRAVIAHLDTLGAQVKRLKPNGRCEVVAIGHWSSRFAEGARVTVFTDAGPLRGSVLPLKASGHTYNKEIDSQPVAWDNVELRIDEPIYSYEDLIANGVNVGDIIAFDPNPEFLPNGYINSRHLDDKAGVSVMLAAIEAINKSDVILPVDCHFLFTISEEIGSGASAVLHGDVAEMLAIDNGTTAPGQNSSEFGVTIGMADTTGPFDWHLTRLLLDLCADHKIPHQRDVFRYYRTDAASAIEAGNDIRTALATFGIDASHGYERIHMDALVSLAKLLTVYVQSPPAVARDQQGGMAPLKDFPTQPGPES